MTNDDTITLAVAKDTTLWKVVPGELNRLGNLQAAIPRPANDAAQMCVLEARDQRIPTRHVLRHGNARQRSGLVPESVHLVLMSSLSSGH